ncbi:hypothetical protein [Halobaculum lipolyticum]|uniref:Uncharacterized protein n=1 Tax=Halobaculum lipolyticum TaxID=3032001 RepID=A0ABD5WBV8_9EURY|nr:hypothetical protein [Halobaculum sp. DT31]
MVTADERRYPLRRDSLVATALGASVPVAYLAGGLASGLWNVAAFRASLSAEVVASLVVAAALADATVAVPVAAYLRLRLVAPLCVLGVVAVGWVGLGAATGLLRTDAVFGLGLYAVGLSPLYLAAYVVLGAGEHAVRGRVSGSS